VEVERLYELGWPLLMLDSGRAAATQIAEKVKHCFGVLAVAYCCGSEERIDFAGAVDPRLEPHILRDIASCEDCRYIWKKKDASGDEIVTAPVSLGGRVIGSLGAIGPSVSEPAWQAVANLAAITVERAKTQAAASRMEAAKRPIGPSGCGALISRVCFGRGTGRHVIRWRFFENADLSDPRMR